MESDKLRAELAHFTGTEEFHRHVLNRRLIWTDGVNHFAKMAQAYWLIDAIAVGVNGRKGPIPSIVPCFDRMVIVLLKITKHGAGLLEIRDDYNEYDESCGKILKLENIEHTDCPEGIWKFYLVSRYDHVVMMVPGEY